MANTLTNKEIINRKNKKHKKRSFERKINDRKKNKRILSTKNISLDKKKKINLSKANEVNRGLNVSERTDKKIRRKQARSKIKNLDYSLKDKDYKKIYQKGHKYD